MTNAQITIFIILGLLLLTGLALFIYYTTNHITKTSSQVPQKSLTSIVVKPIREYVTNCLELAAKDALKTLGLQGGFIYQIQGGTIPDPSPASFGAGYAVVDDTKVAYLIYPPEQSIEPFFFTKLPYYPWDNFPFVIDNIISTIGYYGINTLPPLYNSSSNSIQTQLETAISKNTQACIDWKQFETQGLHIQKSDATAQMQLASTLGQLAVEEAITFTLYWPIEITDVHGTITKLETFSTTIPFPLGKIYYIIRGLIDHEVQDINYTINTISNTTSTYNAFIKHEILNHDDLIILQFPRIHLNEKPYTFQFARHNRPPALFYINPTVLEANTWHAGIKLSVIGQKLIISDPCPNTNTPNEINLQSLDPDENVVQYSLYPVNPLEFKKPTGTNPSYIWRILATDGEYTDAQQFEFKLTCCPSGCPQNE